MAKLLLLEWNSIPMIQTGRESKFAKADRGHCFWQILFHVNAYVINQEVHTSFPSPI
jgi:hypothetical protein